MLPGQPEVPHQLVHGPLVHAPLLALAHGPQPLCGPLCPKGPKPPPALQPGAPELLPLFHAPQGPGAPVVCVFQLLTALAHAESLVHCVGHALPPDVAEKLASGAAVTEAPALAQACAMAWYVEDLSLSLHEESAMQELIDDRPEDLHMQV